MVDKMVAVNHTASTCPGFSWDRVNFLKKLVWLTKTSQSNGIFYSMWCHAQYLTGELAEGRLIWQCVYV